MSYDQWKTTDPRDYEQEEESGASELEDMYDKLHDALEERNLYRDTLAGLYGLLVLISNRDDLSDDLRDIIANNHRSVDATKTEQEAINDLVENCEAPEGD